MNMGFLPTKKYFLLFLIICASLVSTSSAGRRSKFISVKISNDELLGSSNEEISSNKDDINDEVTIHERLLRVNTHDYGRYNPSPSLHRPRHKLIPN
ncbi:hypothetical protein RND81_14G250200 [Saponaria officinalis]|uniref:Uncharacterized protein n=1 Tax=Saponaria officinalis TaxID=3572 RepID=A0AAW1GTL5_SAPOF